MGGHILGGSEEDVQRIHRKIRALNTAPGSYELDDAEALFDSLEKVAQMKRRKTVLVFWGGYTAGLLCGLIAWVLLG
jgi:hypothetical protein